MRPVGARGGLRPLPSRLIRRFVNGAPSSAERLSGTRSAPAGTSRQVRQGRSGPFVRSPLRHSAHRARPARVGLARPAPAVPLARPGRFPHPGRRLRRGRRRRPPTGPGPRCRQRDLAAFVTATDGTSLTNHAPAGSGPSNFYSVRTYPDWLRAYGPPDVRGHPLICRQSQQPPTRRARRGGPW